MPPSGHGEPAARHALRARSDDGVEVGILGGDIVVSRGGWVAGMLRESCPPWLQEVLLVAERRLPMALATAHYAGGVLQPLSASCCRIGEQLTLAPPALDTERARTA